MAPFRKAFVSGLRKAEEDPFYAREDDEGDGDGAPAGDDGGGDGGEGDDGGSDAPMPLSPLAAVHGEHTPQERVIPESLEQIQEARNDPQSLLWDPYAVIDALGYKDRPSPITYATLKAMVWRMPIIQSIIKKRVTQVTDHASPQVDKFSTGYRVVLRDKKQKPTPASEARSQQIERWLQTTGVTDHPESRDDFETFLAKLTRDSLIYDQAAFEIVPSASGKPAEFYAVDASTIRIADTTKLFIDPEDEEVIRYVQIYDGLVVAEYTARQLCFGVRNPASDIRLQGYGQSELEMLISTVTALLWAWDYNLRYFSQGVGAKGIINFEGSVPEHKMRAFRRHWYAMVQGVENAFRTPIMSGEAKMNYVDIAKSNREMEFSAWFDFLIKIACAIYEIDPMEINFKYGDSGAGKQMFESNNTQKLTASKDAGLRPLLRFLSRRISSHLVTPLDEDFEFEFVGLEAMSPNEQADLNAKLVKSTHTIDELRAREDMPPLPNGMGAVILDPTFMAHMSQSAQQEQGTGPFAPPAPPGEDGDGPPGSGGDDGGGEGGDGGGDDSDPFYALRDKGAPKPDGGEGGGGKPFGKSRSHRGSRPSPSGFVVDLDV